MNGKFHNIFTRIALRRAENERNGIINRLAPAYDPTELRAVAAHFRKRNAVRSGKNARGGFYCRIAAYSDNAYTARSVSRGNGGNGLGHRFTLLK